MSNISVNYAKLMEEIGGRASLVCVTKLHEVSEIEELLACGARIVGENRVEEVERKFGDGMLKKRYPGLEMHLIGHLQSRKAKKAVELCDCIDSVDSLELAEKISRCAVELGKNVKVMLEVNVSGETQKYGLSPEDVPAVAKAAVKLPSLELYGLMCMAPFIEDEELIRGVFGGLRKLRDEITKDPALKCCAKLSMGMSHDYRLALLEGSDLLRIGSKLFA
ncbi:YggS family pyridoxal phosphate-dependent enzyme [bacterium]|nr:YggS family pyridoxal phosphate-dependent enzyme [bacterium]